MYINIIFQFISYLLYTFYYISFLIRISSLPPIFNKCNVYNEIISMLSFLYQITYSASYVDIINVNKSIIIF